MAYKTLYEKLQEQLSYLNKDGYGPVVQHIKDLESKIEKLYEVINGLNKEVSDLKNKLGE